MTIRPVFVLFALLAASHVFAEENWPQWRGPNLNGVADAKDLPATWSETENIVWKVALPSWSGGTPVIWGDRISVTSPSKVEGGVGAASAAVAGGRPKASVAVYVERGRKRFVGTGTRYGQQAELETECLFAFAGHGRARMFGP